MLKRIIVFVVLISSSVTAIPLVQTSPHPQVKFDFGIASYAFRNQTLDDVILCALKTNVKKLALKSMHLPLDSSSEEIKVIAKKIKDAGLELYAGAVIYMKTADQVNQAFSYAQAAGMEIIVGVPEPELMDLVEEKVKATGVKVAIHIHGSRKILYPDAASVYPLIKDRDPGIGICLDVGHTIRLNQDPAAVIRQYADRIMDIQLWDSSSASDEGKAILAGYGILNTADILKALIDIEYCGTVSVEYWSDSKTPQYGTAHTIGYCEGILSMLPRHPAQPHNTLSEQEKAEGWQLLFDGKTTRGWRAINDTRFPKQGWAVKDGELQVHASDGGESANGGDIVTQEKYGRFELTWEWKMLTTGGNSGLKYFVVEGLSSNTKYGYGLEYQMLDDANHSWMLEGKMKPGDYRTVGSLYELYPARNKKLRPLGEFNHSRVVVTGAQVEHWLNGIKVLTYKRGSQDFRAKVAASKFKDIPGFGETREGHILLQDHGSELCFRNIKIRSLDQTSKTAINSEDLAYDVITPKQTLKLKAIRDSYGSIPNLDSLYEDRTHTNGLPYHLYVPDTLKRGKKYPLVTFLHGYSDLTIDMHKGFPKGVWSLPLVQAEHPHILFVPRYRTFDDMWVQDNYRAMVIEVLDDLVKEFNGDQSSPMIDSTRLYLTGFSQGGMGTWNFVKHYPRKFAAAAPLSGFSHGPQTVKQAELLRHLPIWIFNGDGDRGVAGSRLSYQMLKRAGAHDVRYHEYEKQGHVIDDFAYFTEGFMDWLFAQTQTSR